MGIRRFRAGTLNGNGSKVLRKRKTETEKQGLGLPENPTAKRKPDGSPQTSRESPSASASASQGPSTMDLDAQSGSTGRSTPGIFTTEVPRARPTHTQVSGGEVTDTEPHREGSTDTVAERHQYAPPLQEELVEEEALTGDVVIDLENLVYREHSELVTARDYIHIVMENFVTTMTSAETKKQADEKARACSASCFDEIYDQLLEVQLSMEYAPLEKGIEDVTGTAQQVFPELLPRVFYKYGEISERVAQRERAARAKQEARWEAEARAQAELMNKKRAWVILQQSLPLCSWETWKE